MGHNRPKFHVILTLDYEIFGNGSGCLDACLRLPVERCLQCVEGYDARLELFVDAPEFLAFRGVTGLAEAAARVEVQLTEAAAGGHGLQLHLHPQWLGASWHDGGWRLRLDRWRIGDLDEAAIDRLVAEGIAYLAMLRGGPAPCLAFRAGGWAIQPATTVLRVLSSHGVVIDSTVAPGCYNPAAGDWYDFRDVPDLPWWGIDEDVCSNAALPGLIEAPITTHDAGRLAHARALREHRAHPALPEGCEGDYSGANDRWQTFRGKLGKLVRLGRPMLDFSTMPEWMLIALCQGWMERYTDHPGPIPIVAIAHGKNFTDHSARNLTGWLDWLSVRDDTVLSSYAGWHAALGEAARC